jgi:hypothetical protein
MKKINRGRAEALTRDQPTELSADISKETLEVNETGTRKESATWTLQIPKVVERETSHVTMGRTTGWPAEKERKATKARSAVAT